MAIESAWPADVAPTASLTVTLKANGLPCAVVGVPAIIPVTAFSDNPEGSEPALNVQFAYGAIPPPAASVTEYGAPTSPPVTAAVVTTTGDAMAIDSACGAEVAPAAS